MPICKKCNVKIPNRIIDSNGTLRYLSSRKYCYICSPPGQHNTRKLDDPEGICKSCGKEFIYDRSKGHRATKCNYCHGKQRHHKLKVKAIEYKGGECCRCGYKKCPGALEFHHRDPKLKKFIIGGSYNRAWKEIELELDKCDMLCSNCHHELHYNGQ